MSAWLTLEALHVEARTRTAAMQRLLGPIDLQLHAGQCLGVVGESGSGKSLTALSLLGLLPAPLQARGRLSVDGAAIELTSAAHARLRGRALAWVPQDPLASLHPLRRVGAQLLETLRTVRGLNAGDADTQARALLERVQLPDPDASLRRYPHQFSGGQRQRIAIALALATQPRALIADEPTSALDARIARDILDLLDRLRREDGLSLLLISHDLPLVGAYAQQLLVLKRGEAIERGATAQVFAAPAQAYTRELLAADRIAPLREGDAAPRPADTPALLVGEGLRMRYPRALAPALDGVDIELHRGEGLALVGESGSGKSTLGRVLLRLLRGAQGRVYLDGVDLANLDAAALRTLRARTGVVFQDPYASLDPRLRVAEIVAEPLRIHGERDPAVRRARAGELLRAVGLEQAMLDRYPHQFSGGQRQRIAIARALATQPQLLVCDEAVSALDAHHRAAILALLVRLKRERGLALLFVTHDLAAAAAVAERIAVLEAGRIVETGATAQVLRAPQHAHTRALLAARPSA
ncbi:MULTISPECIES: ABC transporter ATP-binding protein [unclassified Lysobacter]|uniref:dipeptide ABC transporter ATP-binding protein n=2 Tax=Lysobacter TaxID=68 RepID=UPI001BE730C3|nr:MULTISPECIES: ABC transporter ATP-binding protein [unclassified Lysobacter]MBT2749372.1 ABC transporter ATP-binding protein [Lysobacter sp. ISL-42]MBT2778420.1 ABC transporter ATP-binding protein [Lysobacter sp. ISL-54]MBT2783836.1 ABC transporter ATP-binding protein [Lysobacter sp. ISL-52]